MADLGSYFDKVAAKLLSRVEADPSVSNQHEINGVSVLQPIFGVDQRQKVIYARHIDMENLDDGSQGITRLTWYDARYSHPTRSEWRMYYGPELAPSLSTGGIFVLATRADSVFCFTAAKSSSGAAALRRLFALEELDTRFRSLDENELVEREVAESERLVLAQLGILVGDGDSLLTHLFNTFGNTFPRGEVFSAFVRENTFGVDAIRDPDEALLAWARVELELFNVLESSVESQEMDDAVGLDEKLAVAMRIFQRRKSRAGKAFEYHLRALFDSNGVEYDSNPSTESGEEPDFVFPGIERYCDEAWPARWLTMLAAKQTLRDRWRQVLNEASRIEKKHLATLDVNLSPKQILDISAANIQLVLPAGLHREYSESVSSSFWTVGQFIRHVLVLQRATQGWDPARPA